jgi:hypothetical protein
MTSLDQHAKLGYKSRVWGMQHARLYQVLLNYWSSIDPESGNRAEKQKNARETKLERGTFSIDVIYSDRDGRVAG